MNNGTLLAVVVIAGYIGLEAYTIRAASERTEPAYIHNFLVEAQTATELCQNDALELQPRFDKTLERVAASHRKALTADNPEMSLQAIDKLIQQALSDARDKVTQAVEATGCSDTEARAHFLRYRIYARKTR